MSRSKRNHTVGVLLLGGVVLLNAQAVLAQAAVCNDQWAAWAPDGESIVFVSTHSGDHEIYSLDLSSGVLKQLTDAPGRDAHPSVSPDGARIAFQSPRGSEGTHLYLMGIDGADPRRITSLPGFSGMPVWSPNGRSLAFQHRDTAQGSKWALKTVSLETGRITALTDGTANDQVVNWSPDAGRFVFHSDRSGINQLYLWHDGVVRQLTKGPSENRSGTWSPSGDRIAHVSTREGVSGIYLMDPGELDQTRVGDVVIQHGLPFFSPDGTRLLVTPTTDTGVRVGVVDLRTGDVNAVPGPCPAWSGS